ncbi:hypothetical protein ACHAXS_011698 [Conticribra weissflogii]
MMTDQNQTTSATATASGTAIATKTTIPQPPTPTAPSTSTSSSKKPPPEDPFDEQIRETLGPSLYRLAAGLPKYELDIIVKEARACESALEKEIEILEKELGLHKPDEALKPSSSESDSNNDIPAEESKTNNKHGKKGENVKNKNDYDDLQEPTMISIPQLPSPYQPGGGRINYLDSADAMLATEFAPPDRYFTVSALMGRLRDPLKLPHPPNAARVLEGSGGVAGGGGRGSGAVANGNGGESEQERKKRRIALEKQQALLLLDKNEAYHRKHPDTTALLQLWKRVTSHRTAAVFRKPVNPLEAPGYTDRILFPMDLSLVRKMIVAKMIRSYADFHGRVGLICHNCVKFNGRESDYAIITRDFEAYVDDQVLTAVKNASSD